MFAVLAEVEALLPRWLAQQDWNSLHVTYEPPEVERLWRQWGEYRIFLHRIHPCDRPLFHPHPWPSIARVLAGVYEMKVGHGAGLDEPPVAMTILAGPGTIYAMTERDCWHSVRPISGPSYSLMVAGKPWGREMPRAEHPPQGPLAPERRDELLRAFAALHAGPPAGRAAST